MIMCTINCDNNKVEVCVLLCLFYKMCLNKPNDNYCTSVSHKPPFEGLPSECDGGQWRILTNIVGGAQIIHPKFIHFIIVNHTIKNEVYEEN